MMDWTGGRRKSTPSAAEILLEDGAQQTVIAADTVSLIASIRAGRFDPDQRRSGRDN
jgi:hypothetical protein